MTWEYTSELGDQICNYICEGKTLREINDIEGMPSRPTILRWLKNGVGDFESKYARARQVQGELAAEEHYDIIQSALAGHIAPDLARVVLGGLEWHAKKKEPKVYGDSNTIKGDPENPVLLSLKVEHVGND